LGESHLEIVNWKSAAGNWRLEIGGWKLAAGNWPLEIMAGGRALQDLDIGSCK
jgi:hypothetical protein